MNLLFAGLFVDARGKLSSFDSESGVKKMGWLFLNGELDVGVVAIQTFQKLVWDICFPLGEAIIDVSVVKRDVSRCDNVHLKFTHEDVGESRGKGVSQAAPICLLVEFPVETKDCFFRNSFKESLHN